MTLLAPNFGPLCWQRRLDPLQWLVFNGCHLTRPIADLLTAAGFTITELDRFYATGAPKFAAATFLGVARPE
jgi:hypothetical protein